MARRRRIHVPQRTCVGCRQVQPKREMIRVVRTPNAGVQIDATGKHAGRGAYLCSQPTCWTVALTEGQLDRALRTHLSTKERDTLLTMSRAYTCDDSLRCAQAGTGERIRDDG